MKNEKLIEVFGKELTDQIAEKLPEDQEISIKEKQKTPEEMTDSEYIKHREEQQQKQNN